MTVLTFGEAAAQLGLAEETVAQYVAAGRLRGATLPDGSPGVESTELVEIGVETSGRNDRLTVSVGGWHPSPAGKPATDVASPPEPGQRVEGAGEIAALQRRIDELEGELSAAREREARLLGIIEGLSGAGGK